MPVPPQRDQVATRASLSAWIAARHQGAGDVTVGEIGGPAATGFSHETLLFDARWTADGIIHQHRLVARIEPTEHTVFLEPDFAGECRVMRTLASRTDVPMPRILGYEEDASFLGAPFLVMEAVDGLVPSDNPPHTFGGWPYEERPEDQERLWWSGLEALAAVHRLDWQGLGLGFLEPMRRDLDGELDWCERYMHWTGGAPGVVEAALAWLRSHRPPDDRPPCLCWGDARIGNQIFRDFRCVAVLDWEMATIARPEQDLGWWLYFDKVFSDGLGVPRLPGFPSHAETVARYEELTGRTVRDLEFFEVLAGFRFSVIMMRLGRLLEMFGQPPNEPAFGPQSFSVNYLVRQLEQMGASA